MSAPSGTLALLASRIRADDKRILEAIERRGAAVEQVDTRRLTFAVETVNPPWTTVLNREISATRALHAAHSLEAAGSVVLNRAAAIGVCADKWLTSLALRRDEVPTPRTVLALTPEAALSELETFGYPAVLKPITGSWGRRVSLVREPDAARAVLEHCAAIPSPAASLIYIQEFIDKPGRDIRVIVIGDRPIAAAYRESTDWRCNVALGAQSRQCEMTAEIAKLATAAARAVGADIAGVDLVERRDGTLMVLEVNHNVEFAGIQAAHAGDVDIAQEMADFVLSREPA